MSSVNYIDKLSVSELFKNILKGNITYLSKAITLIESSRSDDIEKASILLQACLPYSNKSIRIGVTGVPGVGKSTFIESLGIYLLQLGKRVAVLTIDPSSSINKGSILGDKTRMEKLAKEKNAFIRPSPSGTTLGGVAFKTKETILLCEAAGYDVILIETVGVGQSETFVHSMVDFFLLLKLAGSGDELQGIKRGIMELADTIVINKADGDNIKNVLFAKNEFQRALHLYPMKKNKWQARVMTCSAIENKGISEIWQIILIYIKHTKSNQSFDEKRNDQNISWFKQSLENQLLHDFYNNEEIKNKFKIQVQNIKSCKITPFEASNNIMEYYSKLEKNMNP